MITGDVFCQQHQMVAAEIRVILSFIQARPRRHIGFATDDRLDSGIFKSFIHVQRAAHETVIGHGHGRHIVKFSHFQQPGRSAGPVQQAVVRL